MKEQPILDTTALSKVKEGMWCEYDNANTDAHYCGVLEKIAGTLELNGHTVTYNNDTLAAYVKNLRVYEHKPQPEYPTKEGFYRFDGTVYRMFHTDMGKNVWQAVYGVNTGSLNHVGSALYNDGALRSLYPDVTPIPYKLVPEEDES